MATSISVTITNPVQCFELLKLLSEDESGQASVLLDHIAEHGDERELLQVINFELWRASDDSTAYLKKFADLLLAQYDYKSAMAILRHVTPSDDADGFRSKACDIMCSSAHVATQALEQYEYLQREEIEKIVQALLPQRRGAQRASAFLQVNRRFGHTILAREEWRECLNHRVHSAREDVYSLLARGKTFYPFGSNDPERVEPLTAQEREKLIEETKDLHAGWLAYNVLADLREGKEIGISTAEIRTFAAPAIEFALKDPRHGGPQWSPREKCRNLRKSPAAVFFTEEQLHKLMI